MNTFSGLLTDLSNCESQAQNDKSVCDAQTQMQGGGAPELA